MSYIVTYWQYTVERWNKEHAVFSTFQDASAFVIAHEEKDPWNFKLVSIERI